MIFMILFYIGISGCTLCLIFVGIRIYQSRMSIPYFSFSELYEREGLIGFLQIINMHYPMYIALIAGICAIMAIIGLSGFNQ